MKRILILLFMTCHTIFAASGSADGFGYTWIDSNETEGPVYSWVDITSADNLVSTSGEAAATLTISPPVVLYGETITALRASTNGYLSTLLSDSGEDNTFDTLLPAKPDIGGGKRLYPLHGKFTDSTKIFHAYIPQAAHPNSDCGAHVITWSDAIHSEANHKPVSFQVILFDNFDIIYQYDTEEAINGVGTTTGLQSSGTGTHFHSIACDIEKSIPDSYAILILPPSIVVRNITDGVEIPGKSLRDALLAATNGTRIILDERLADQTIGLTEATPLLTAKSVAIQAPTGSKIATGKNDEQSSLVILDLFQVNHCYIQGIDSINGFSMADSTLQTMKTFSSTTLKSVKMSPIQVALMME